MDDALLVCCSDRVRERDRDLEELIDRETLFGKKLGECFALDQLQGDEVDAVGLLDGMNSNNVGMVERSDGFGFTLEPGTPLFALG